MFTSILVTPQSPFPTLSFLLPSHLPISSLSAILSPICAPSQQSLSLQSGLSLPSSTLPLSSLSPSTTINSADDSTSPIFIRLAVRLPGGKGGFASQLRAQGGRMSSNKATNNDSCRDLNGRRLSTIKEATKLAKYLETAGDRDRAEKLELKERKEALEIEVNRLEASVMGVTSAGGGKRKLEDSKYIEESKEMVEGVRDAVKLAMMKKRKKNNTSSTLSAASSMVTIIETAPPQAEASGSSSTLVEEEVVAETTKEEEEVVKEEAAAEKKEVKGKGKKKA